MMTVRVLPPAFDVFLKSYALDDTDADIEPMVTTKETDDMTVFTVSDPVFERFLQRIH
jgi:hypothetical protein